MTYDDKFHYYGHTDFFNIRYAYGTALLEINSSRKEKNDKILW